MEVTFTQAAKDRLEKFLTGDTKMVLDFDDGVGPFSDAATCTMALSFNLLFVKPDTDLHDFDQTISSNLGKIYVKGYSMDQMDEKMTIDVNEKYLRYSLSGQNGEIDSSIGIKNLAA